MKIYRLRCFKNDPSGGCWVRHVTFPFPPYPGLCVGSHVVKEVFVCQGELDGTGDVEVRLDDAKEGEEGILEMHGWEYHE